LGRLPLARLTLAGLPLGRLALAGLALLGAALAVLALARALSRFALAGAVFSLALGVAALAVALLAGLAAGLLAVLALGAGLALALAGLAALERHARRPALGRAGQLADLDQGRLRLRPGQQGAQRQEYQHQPAAQPQPDAGHRGGHLEAPLAQVAAQAQ